MKKHFAPLCSLFCWATFASWSTHVEAADFELTGLGRQFDAVAAKLDRAIEHGLNIDWSDLKEFGRIVDEIVVTPATTIEGLCVKARVGCWGSLGDLDDLVRKRRLGSGWLFR